jgi:Flp pilus assembly protein TadD
MTRGGTLFLDVDSQVPMTLPSHTSLLTSTYPFFNQVEENGDVVPPGTLTLAALLKSRGYHTAAFIGGASLDRQFGLDQGFDVYDSPFGPHGQFSVKRPGKDVVNSALRWLDVNSSQPFFLFLHLFDLHRPYALLSAGEQDNPSGYETELRYVDDALGQFWDSLAERGILGKALIVFTSDHGESLGEHGEDTHQYFIYQSTVWVPLIFHWPSGGDSYPAKVDQPASLLDVAPTLLQLLRTPPPPQFQGHTLFSLLNSGGGNVARSVYSESVFARDHFGCSALRSLRSGRFKYIEAAKPELYDLESDPHELRNLYQKETSTAGALRQQLLELQARFTTVKRSQPNNLSAETVALLGSLGYAAMTYPQSGSAGSGCDPKDRLAEYHLNSQGIKEAETGNCPAATQTFKRIIAGDPTNVFAHYYLAVCDYRLRVWDDAASELHRTLELAPTSVQAHELLGTVWLETGHFDQARETYVQLLHLDPKSYAANYNLGVFAMRDGHYDEAARYLRAAAEIDPESHAPHNELGLSYLKAGNLHQAEAEFKRAISLQPKGATLHYNLGMVYVQLKRKEAAAQEFREALKDDPAFRLAEKALDDLRK